MLFSVILPSYLGEYKNAASNRPAKLIRAIDSVINQTIDDIELIVVSDGCMLTNKIVTEHIGGITSNKSFSLVKIPKQPMFGGSIRNAGLNIAKGEYIIYIDADDYYGAAYLAGLMAEIETDHLPWYFVHEFRRDVKNNTWYQHYCNPRKMGNCGTSNIIHNRGLLQWNATGYGVEDWQAIKSLIKTQYRIIDKTCGYHVCHIPNEYDV